MRPHARVVCRGSGYPPYGRQTDVTGIILCTRDVTSLDLRDVMMSLDYNCAGKSSELTPRTGFKHKSSPSLNG